MNLPKSLEGRPAAAVDLLHSTSLTVLGTLFDKGILPSTELGYGFEDLPLLDELSGLVRDAARFWHMETKIATDFAVLRRGFVHCFLLGLDCAGQIHRADGEGLRLPTSLSGVFDGRTLATVPAPLDALAKEHLAAVEDLFVDVQDKVLGPIVPTRNQDLLYDAYGCCCLWIALAGCDLGLGSLPEA